MKCVYKNECKLNKSCKECDLRLHKRPLSIITKQLRLEALLKEETNKKESEA